MKKPTLGLCMITINEEGKIGKAIESVIESVDVVYLTDTGSTDGTIEEAKKVCKRAGKKIEVTQTNPQTHPEIYCVNDTREDWELMRDLGYLPEEYATDYEAWLERDHQAGDLFNFAIARNYNFSQAKTDYILWIDADDIVENGELIGTLMEKINRFTGIHLWYRYQVNDKDEDIIGHNKLRIVKNGLYEWTSKAPIHENLFPIEGVRTRESHVPEVSIKHLKTKEGFIVSGRRNIRALKALEKREQGNKDPRTVFLLGREAHNLASIEGKNDYDETIKYLKEYTDISGWGSERMNACTMLCDIYLRLGKYKEQERWAFEAVKSDPNHPLGYVEVAGVYSMMGKYKETIDWVERSLRMEISDVDSAIHTPAALKRKQSLLLIDAYMEMKDFEKADAVARRYFNEANEDDQDELVQAAARCEIGIGEEKQINAFLELMRTARALGKWEGMMPLINILPEELHVDERVISEKRKIGLGKHWPKGNIAIYCGIGHEEWDAGTIEEKGAGGSETAVVEMAKRFGAMGYKVAVYNSVDKVKHYGNVTYYPAEEINWSDTFDIFVSWRNPMLFKLVPIAANKKYLWLHDVPIRGMFTEKVVGNVDKIIVLSKFHRQFLSDIPDEKFYISSNGIDLPGIEAVEKMGVERDPNKVIYVSSPDRGLDRLLDIWEKVKEMKPEAELYWAYGWNTFDALRKDNPELMKWKEEMIKRMDKLGVHQLGRLNKEELYKLYFSATVWAYPTAFDEINCIVAQEAQACGCYPISTGHAALAEMQKTGETISDKYTSYDKYQVSLPGGEGHTTHSSPDFSDRDWVRLFAKRIVAALENKSFGAHLDLSILRGKFSWDTTANAWANDLFYGAEFEQSNPLVSVVCITIRPGPFRVLRETLEKQTYQNYELIVVDGRYDERADDVAAYMKDFDKPFLHLPDPKRNKKYPYGLYHADNAAIAACRGELVVFVQDFIEMPTDGIEKYVDLYMVFPNLIYTGVDTRNQTVAADEVTGISRNVDIYCGGGYEVQEAEFTSPRIRLGGAIRLSKEAMEWELNYAAAPKRVLEILGGWDPDWDKAFGYDNTILAARFLYDGGAIIVDETNQCTALSHWQLFGDNDSEGVPHRDKKTNDKRYVAYLNYLHNAERAKVRLEFAEPKYDKETQARLDAWLNSDITE